MSENLGLGNRISPHRTACRDAVHIAVAPVMAHAPIGPGQHVMLIGKGDQAVPASYAASVGIVDPFLVGGVEAGERFWLFLHPGSITSLRHEWTHPAFEDAPSAGTTYEMAEAEKYLRGFAAEWGMEYDEMIDNAVSGGGLVAGDRDIHSWHEVDDGGTEFWRCLEIVTGRGFSKKFRENVYFTCNC